MYRSGLGVLSSAGPVGVHSVMISSGNIDG